MKDALDLRIEIIELLLDLIETKIALFEATQ